MADSEIDTTGLSVASRIRMYQNNAGGGSPKNQVTPKNSDGRPSSPKEPTLRLAAVTPKNFKNSSPTSSPKLAPSQAFRPPKSPNPSPRPSPKMQQKTKETLSSNKVHDVKDASNVAKDNINLPKPPLPSKPPTVLKDNPSKDVNDNCNAKPAISKNISDPGPDKRPLVAKFSSEKLAENRMPSAGEDNKWKRISGPPSRPLPPAPSALSNTNTELLDTGSLQEASSLAKPRSKSRQDVYEVVDMIYEEPDGSEQEKNAVDGEYEDPNSCNISQELPAGRKLANKDRKILSRISTSRRPPPLPNLNADNQKKSLKPPPLPSRNVIQTAEEQAVYSYASDGVDMFPHKSPSVHQVKQDSSYEVPDMNSVRGLMVGLINKAGTYETPDSSCVNEFMASVNVDESDCNDVYEEPVNDGSLVRANNISKGNQITADSDSDSDAYCDPESIPDPPSHRGKPHVPLAPQKSLPPPPLDDGNESEDSGDDSSHDYEDPSEEIRPSARVLSLRRGSQPVLNPDAYLALQDMDLDSTYQDPVEAFASINAPLDTIETASEEDDYEDLADEPLYQVYAADVLSEMRRKSDKGYKGEEDVFSEYSTGSIEAGQRLLWCQLPSVRDSGVLESLEPRERKRQEAMFEVITSEASYLKSLAILVNYFMNEFLEKLNNPGEEKIIDKQQFHFLFGGLPIIKSISEKFLHSLRGKQEENFVISSISDTVHDYAATQFECYVKYCSNQVYQERTLTRLVNENQALCDFLGKLESSTKSQGLSLQSFLMLPMQRITRLPLLMDAICHHCEPGSDEFHKTDKALSAVHKVVKACNEGARKMERIEEMYFVQQMLTFKMKPIPIVSSSRWLLRRGELACLEGERKLRGLKTLLRGGKYYRIYLFLFNDLLLVTKMKGEDSFKVVDHCSRALLRIDDESVPTGDTLKQGSVGIPTNKYMFSLILLENHLRKTVTYVCLAETETEKIRWIDAVNPKSSAGDNAGEKIYEEWDCPQVRAIHSYQAEQHDELTLREGDVIKVLRKLPDGWYEGMQLIDGETGWFPANHTEEILSEHTRARNLMQRYRLINTVTLAFDTKTKKS